MNDEIKRLERLENENEKLEAQIKNLKKKIQDDTEQMEEIQRSLRLALHISQDLIRTRSFKFVHLLSRFKNQFCKGTPEERKAFIQWISTRWDKKAVDNDHRYNPLFQLVYPLQKAYQLTQESHTFSEIHAINCSEMLSYAYKKYDVIVFSVIDYDFRYQRPQQIADHYAKRGHRVFYINANFKSQGVKSVLCFENLYKITLRSKEHVSVYSHHSSDEYNMIQEQVEDLIYEYGIRDALMIADYPTWVQEIEYFKKKYGFALITDYMDDFTGFVTTSEPFVKDSCIRLLKISDAVVASSQYLVDVAKQYNANVIAIRNGTEFKHFHQAYTAVGTGNNLGGNRRKVIGYYGAIAEWFDAEKIEYVAKRFAECDVVLIGNVTNERIKACKLKNVKLLGEIPYAKLPEYLQTFDVCLIPFDTTTSLIKATNPVKFYEYLSAAKKTVATEIPELEPFKNRYVYLANDNEQFAAYVEKCLNGTDELAPAEECFDFARENDWTQRVRTFENVAVSLFPKVSIVVLCYNQLDYTKQCVQSVLENTAYPNYELILVDNCSEDGTADYLRMVEKQNEHVKIVINETNRGFAGGNNDGIAVSNGEYVLLLNNDTLVTRGWITNMIKHFKRFDRVGIVGAVTNSIGNEAQIKVSYEELNDMPAFAYDYTRKHMNQTYDHSGVLAMFCVMLSRELIEKIGMLDENYGIGMFEDDDYSVAAERAGYKLILPEDVFIHHFGSVSFKNLEDETYRKIFEENKAYFEKKWNTKWKMHYTREVTMYSE